MRSRILVEALTVAVAVATVVVVAVDVVITICVLIVACANVDARADAAGDVITEGTTDDAKEGSALVAEPPLPGRQLSKEILVHWYVLPVEKPVNTIALTFVMEAPSKVAKFMLMA